VRAALTPRRYQRPPCTWPDRSPAAGLWLGFCRSGGTWEEAAVARHANFVAWSLLSFHHEIADATQVIVFEVEGEEVFKPSVAVQLRLLELRL